MPLPALAGPLTHPWSVRSSDQCLTFSAPDELMINVLIYKNIDRPIPPPAALSAPSSPKCIKNVGCESHSTSRTPQTGVPAKKKQNAFSPNVCDVCELSLHITN